MFTSSLFFGILAFLFQLEIDNRIFKNHGDLYDLFLQDVKSFRKLHKLKLMVFKNHYGSKPKIWYSLSYINNINEGDVRFYGSIRRKDFDNSYHEDDYGYGKSWCVNINQLEKCIVNYKGKGVVDKIYFGEK